MQSLVFFERKNSNNKHFSKVFFCLLLAVFTLTQRVTAQNFGEQTKNEKIAIGLHTGFSGFLGDLSIVNRNNSEIVPTVYWQLMRPYAGLSLQYTINQRFTLQVFGTYTILKSDDKAIEYDEVYDANWYLHYRNLNFTSNLLELKAQLDIKALQYKFISNRILSLHFHLGIGAFYFNPKTTYFNSSTGRNEWVFLRNLGTEGQSLPSYPSRKKYSLFQVNIPLGSSIMFQINEAWKVGLEWSHRITFTDYIDDVSTEYVASDLFFEHYDTETATLASALSRRSVEIDAANEFGFVTEAGQIRGRSTYDDAYFTLGICLVKRLNARKDKGYHDCFGF
ncbi:MAG: hypothetical protein ACPG5B_14270 [Chitinophagales bacterium]